MKKTLSLALLIASLLAVKPAVAQVKPNTDTVQISPEKTEKEISFSADASFLTHYVSNGLQFSSGNATQTNLSFSYKNVTASHFLNFDNTLNNFTESDITVDYETKLTPNISSNISFTYLSLPNSELVKSREAKIGATLDSTLLNPTFEAAKDFDQGKGTFYRASASWSIPNHPINLSAEIGYNDKYWRQMSGWSHVGVKVQAEHQLTDAITITETLGYNVRLDKREPEVIQEGINHTEIFNQGFMNINFTFNN